MAELDDTGTHLRLQPSWCCRVLVVDDDELVRAQLVAILRLAGYNTLEASSAAEALQTLSATPCHIVLTDWQMPDMDGLALCHTLRLKDNEAYVYILMHTIRRGAHDVVMGLASGADDYVVKGAPAAEILARVAVGRRITHLEHSLRASNVENQRLAVTDALTGSHNRRYLMKYLPRELDRARRYEHPLSILSCDIDEFKRINDNHGHEAGDEVLQEFTTRTLSCIRESIDWVARVGGEEFVVVLPETRLSGASRVAEKLRTGLSGRVIQTASGSLRVTVSIGVTAVETPSELASVSVVQLLRAADRCLYASKNLGRDRATAMPAASVVALMSLARPGAKNEIN